MSTQPDFVRVDPHRPPNATDRSAMPAGVVVFARSVVPSRLMPHHAIAQRVLREYRLRVLDLHPAWPAAAGAAPAAPLPVQAQAERIVDMLDRARQQPELAPLATGLFAEMDVAAPAIQAAALRPGRLAALVVLDAGAELSAGLVTMLRAPTLLIVSGADSASMRHSRSLMRALECKKRLEIVPTVAGGTDDSGMRQAVLHLACSWFAAHMVGRLQV